MQGDIAVSPASTESMRAGQVLTKAVIKVADHLAIRNGELARTLGVSDATVTRMRRGDHHLQRGTKPFEIGQILLRMFRSLDSITGGDDKSSSSWLQSENTALAGKPVVLMQSILGLTRIVDYLDSRRGPV